MPSFSKEDIRKARQADIVSYLESVNVQARAENRVEPYPMKREGKEIRVTGYGGLLVNNNYWSRQTDKTGGNTLDFLTRFEGKSFVEAMEILTGKEMIRHTQARKPRDYVVGDKSNFVLPERFDNSRRVIAYLTKSRYLDSEIVINEIKKHNLFEDKDHHNCIFVGRSPDGQPRWANKRSSLTDRTFKGDVKDTDPRYPFVIRNAKNRDDGYLVVTESPIEAMSYATILKIQGGDPYKHDIMGIGGAHGVGVHQYLKDHPQTRGVLLALNNDRQGHESTALIENELKQMGYTGTIKKWFPDKAEDWNQFLENLIKKREQERKFNEERGIVGEVKLQLQPGQEPQSFLVSKEKIMRNGAENIVLYGKESIATLNMDTRTFGVAVRGKELKDTYFVRKNPIDDIHKDEIIVMVEKAVERELKSLTHQKNKKLTREELLAKDPKELTTEQAIQRYKLQKQMQKSNVQTRNRTPVRTQMR